MRSPIKKMMFVISIILYMCIQVKALERLFDSVETIKCNFIILNAQRVGFCLLKYHSNSNETFARLFGECRMRPQMSCAIGFYTECMYVYVYFDMRANRCVSIVFFSVEIAIYSAKLARSHTSKEITLYLSGKSQEINWTRGQELFWETNKNREYTYVYATK